METVIGGLFNAVAFAGAGFLFSKLNHSGYEKEIKRHNEAKEKWYEEQVKRKEEIEKLRQQLSDANADINKTNMSLKNLAEINNNFKNLQNEYYAAENEPKLEDYYKPSDEMKEYKILSFSIIGIGTGYVVYKFIK